jgi:hypothetical protein
MWTRTTRGAIAGLLAASALLAAPVWAQGAPQDPRAAEALFQTAKALADQGQWAEACPKFDASFKLDEQLGTLLNLANCWEQVGKVASAWVRWNEAVEWARRDGDDRLGWIQDRQSKVVARLPKLLLQVEHPVATLVVLQDGRPVPSASFGVALPVDPGSVTLRIVRGQDVLEERQVQAEEGKVTEVKLDLQAIDRAHPAATPPPVPPTGPTPPPKPDEPSEPYDPTQRNVGIAVGAVGIAAVLAAAGLEIAALVKKGEANEPDACQNGFCSPQGLRAADQGATFAEVGQWVGIGGLAALAIGVTVFLTAPSEEPARARMHPPPLWLAPWVGHRAGGLGLGGTL